MIRYVLNASHCLPPSPAMRMGRLNDLGGLARGTYGGSGTREAPPVSAKKTAITTATTAMAIMSPPTEICSSRDGIVCAPVGPSNHTYQPTVDVAARPVDTTCKSSDVEIPGEPPRRNYGELPFALRSRRSAVHRPLGELQILLAECRVIGCEPCPARRPAEIVGPFRRRSVRGRPPTISGKASPRTNT